MLLIGRCKGALMNKLLLVLLLALSGCATKLPQPNVTLPPSITQKCQPLVKVEGTSGADLLRNIVTNAEIYYECSDMHDKLILAVKPKP